MARARAAAAKRTKGSAQLQLRGESPEMPREVPECSSCAAREEGEESDASTTASATERHLDSPGLRWADVAESEDEAAGFMLPAGAGSEPLPGLKKTRWADLADSDDEDGALQVQTEALCKAAPPLVREQRSRPHAWKQQQQQQQPSASGGSCAKSSSSTAQPWWQGRVSSGWSSEHPRRGGKAQNWSAGWQTHSASQWDAGSYGRRQTGPRTGKQQCQFIIGIEQEEAFHVKRRLLGPHGQHMKAIAEHTGAKLRLRGRGSGFLEGAEQVESSDPLMLCLSAPDPSSYSDAKRQVLELLHGVHASYRTYCLRAGWPAPDLEVEVHEGPRPGSC